ncbi:MAG: Outer membrane protein TolC [Gammaproteobacteria bacterium]|nr:MAG: Outer membrane protein TolC [Gammaproteobacteria bacterium]
MYKISFFLTMLLFISPVGYAADLLDIYNRSLDFNNELKIKNNNHKISEELYNQTASTIFPEVSIIANTEENNINKYVGPGSTKDYTSETASLKITQPLLRLYFFDELNKANSKIDKSRINVNNFKKDLLIKSTDLYFTLINLKNNYRANFIKTEMMSKKLDNAKKLYQNGYITNIELNRYKNSFSLADVELEISRNQLELAKQDVYMFTGKDILEIHNLNHMIGIPISNYDVESLTSTAMVTFDNIKIAMLDVDISKNEIESNKSKHFPTIDLTATYDYSDVRGGARFGVTTRESNTVGLTLNFPIYQGGYQNSKISEAKYKYQNAKLNLDQLRRSVRRDINDKINTHNLLKKVILVKRDKYNDSNENYKTMISGYKKGIYSDIDLKESEYNLIIAKNELISSTLEYMSTDLSIKKYSSELSIRHIEDINKMLVW